MIADPVIRFMEGLRFPVLFTIGLGIFLLDLAIPDVIPFIDEVLLAVGTLLLAKIKKRRDDRETTLESSNSSGDKKLN